MFMKFYSLFDLIDYKRQEYGHTEKEMYGMVSSYYNITPDILEGMDRKWVTGYGGNKER